MYLWSSGDRRGRGGEDEAKQIWSIEQRDPMSARAENSHTNFLPPQVNREGGKTSIFYIKIRFIIKYAFKIENLKVVILCFCNLSLFFLLKILHFLPRQNIHPWNRSNTIETDLIPPQQTRSGCNYYHQSPLPERESPCDARIWQYECHDIALLNIE